MFEKEFERLGGVSPLESTEFDGLSDEDIREIEDRIGKSLPDDYKKFLQQYGEVLFNKSVGFKPVDKHALYQHDTEVGLPNPEFSGSQVSVFFGKGSDYPSSLMAKLEVYDGRMPESVMPIADDGLGNKICIGIGSTNHGKVYWWDHHNEWDEDDYEDEIGVEMPEEAKFQNLYLLAPSFTKFLKKLFVVAD